MKRPISRIAVVKIGYQTVNPMAEPVRSALLGRMTNTWNYGLSDEPKRVYTTHRIPKAKVVNE
jgi:hypothetical protein